MPADRPLVQYLHDLHLIRATGAGTDETSFYGPLENLLNAVGDGLKPKVRAVFQLQNLGAGHPDFGLFTADQFERRADDVPREGQHPSRGAGEVKGVDEDLGPIVSGFQVSKYWERYRQVLVTNYRQFAFISEGRIGQPIVVEQHSLGDSAGGFWATAAHASRLSSEDEASAITFLERCLRHAAPVDQPRDLAWFLASYAREARLRLDSAPLDTLADLRSALQTALGVTFSGERGERFFLATVVQTLFYGVFSAWTLWHREDPDREDEFIWQGADQYLRLPILESLFHRLTGPTLRRLGLTDLLDRTARTFARVDRERFFKRFADTEAIQYFYEPFLEAYDPELRKQLGVWYTPPEVVRYMVRRVDDALKEELDVPDGLADDRVVVLDPACGTGAFLVETLRHIRRHVEEHGEPNLAAARVKRAVTTRLFGFEVLTAPFVVAHLQMGLALRSIGAPLKEEERAGIYLTNALTDWSATANEQPTFGMEFRQEVESARRVKRQEKILVVIGNPPYEDHPGVSIHEEGALVDVYRTPKRSDIPRPEGRGLNDLYVRFFRIAERQIANRTGRGVVCYITNNSWLDGRSHTAMRERFLKAFDRIHIDNLHGDKRRTGKLTPEGDPDPSVFSTPHNREGIQVGTSVALLVRATGDGAPHVQYRDFWGAQKRSSLAALANGDSLASLGADPPPYRQILPEPRLGLPFLPRVAEADYLDWPLLPELFPNFFPGVFTARDQAVVDIDREKLLERVTTYYDPQVTDEAIEQLFPELMRSTSRFDARTARRALMKRGFREEDVVRYAYRPFDNRWLYWEMDTPLVDRPRPEYRPHVFEGNLWLGAVKQNRKSFDPAPFAPLPASLHLIERGASFFPLYLRPDLTTVGSLPRVNISERAGRYLDEVGGKPEDLFYHALAVMHTPAYREENAGALKQDWPRIPLPETLRALENSADLGRRVAELLDPDTPVRGVTTGRIGDEYRLIARPARIDGGQLSEAAGDFNLEERWGYLGHQGQTMPGPGRITRRPLPKDLPQSLGPAALHVHLNENAYWADVPDAVWNYTLGGYQVLKKWLSYRQINVLGRPLRLEEIEHFTHTARRIAALVGLGAELDGGYAGKKE